MDIKDIQYVLAIAEEQNFSKAAARLYISQPALSLCVQRLEREFETKLFFRGNNKVALTSAGRLFVEHGARIIEMNQQMKQRIYDVINFEQGSIKVGISQFYGRYYSPRLFRVYQQCYPGIRIEIREDFSNHLEEYILSGELDLCIIPAPLTHDGIAYEPLFQEEIYFAISKELDIAKKVPPNFSNNIPSIDLRLVKDLPFIMLKKHQKIRRISERICANAGFVPHIVFESQDLNTINNFISLNMGVGFVPDIIEKTSDVKDLVDYYQIKSDVSTRTFMIAYKQQATLSNACKNFIKTAQESFRGTSHINSFLV